MVFGRTATCPSFGPSWKNCGRLVGTVGVSTEARALYAELVEIVALNGAAVAQGGEPPLFCPADSTSLRFQFTLRTAHSPVAVASLRDNGPAGCSRGWFSRPVWAVPFDLWPVELRFSSYLVRVGRDIGVAPERLCPKSEAVDRNLCGSESERSRSTPARALRLARAAA